MSIEVPFFLGFAHESEEIMSNSKCTCANCYNTHPVLHTAGCPLYNERIVPRQDPPRSISPEDILKAAKPPVEDDLFTRPGQEPTPDDEEIADAVDEILAETFGREAPTDAPTKTISGHLLYGLLTSAVTLLADSKDLGAVVAKDLIQMALDEILS